MNASATIFALALASNHQPQQHFEQALLHLAQYGQVLAQSAHYLIPCRDGIGADYWNSACLLQSQLHVSEMLAVLKELEQKSGRVRPSHCISLDIDLIAWGSDLAQMQFNPKKMPLALDVKIPMADIWPCKLFAAIAHDYPIVGHRC